MDKFQCDIIVLTWNHLELTKKFFESLFSSTALKIKIIVVDQASSDRTREYLEQLKQNLAGKLEIILNPENIGFVKGVNLGLTLSSAPFICLANNDLIFTKGWLEEVIKVFEKNKFIGILNPNSNNLGMHAKGQETIESLAVDLSSSYSGIFAEMPFCSGFCMVMRREILDKSGGLSQDYIPMFFEDTDISMQAKAMGYLIGLAKGAYVWHKEHGSFREGNDSDQLFRRNQRLFQDKYGKTLRIAWLEDNPFDLLNDLQQAISLGRSANFVTFYNRNIGLTREDAFKSLNAFEHSAVKFKKFESYVVLFFSILIKKKKFDLIVTKNRVLCFLFKALGQRVANRPDDILINRLKKRLAK